MVGRNTRVEIDPSSYIAEAQERARRESDERVASIRARQAAFDAAQKESADRRHQREIDATVAKQEAVQRRAEAQQAAQWAWATRRNELRDQVAELRRAIQDCESRMDTAPMPEAIIAASERQVLDRRLAAAEREYATHMASQPA